MGMNEIQTPFKPGVVMAAAPDAIRMAIGHAPKHPHPLADGLTLRQIAYAAGLRTREPSSIDTDQSIMARGMRSQDFGSVLADAYAVPTRAAYDSSAGDHLAIAATIEVENFKPVEMPALDADIKLELLAENGSVKHGVAMLAAGSRAVRLVSYAKAVLVSRETIINDQARLISQTVSSSGASAARIEARLIADALENPASLDDGAPVFGIAHGNLLEEALTGPSLGAAMALLRTQPTSAGQRSGLAAKFIVTSPELEYTTRHEIKQSGLDLEVSVLADLPPARWYLLADPIACPAVGILRLTGTRHPIRVEQRRANFEIDGTLIQVAADLGATVLRRTGIVRGGLTA